MAGSAAVHLTNVSPNFFRTLGVLPGLGHGFEENVEPFNDGKNANTLILSDAAWRQMYGGDPAILGKKVLLNGKGLYRGWRDAARFCIWSSRTDRPGVWTSVRLDEAR